MLCPLMSLVTLLSDITIGILTKSCYFLEVTANTCKFSRQLIPLQFYERENCIQKFVLNFLHRYPYCLKHPQYAQKQTRNIISRQDIIAESQLRPDRQTEVFGITHR